MMHFSCVVLPDSLLRLPSPIFSILPLHSSMSNPTPPKILKDSDAFGGTALRSVDRSLSTNLGGVHSAEAQAARRCDSTYGNYVEPVLHATEHAMRAVGHANAAEWARAKDELKTVGRGGLPTNDHVYQKQAQAPPKPAQQ
jgi:hypothetical protein